MSRATYVPRRKEGDNPVYFNNFRERIQGDQWRRESCAVGRAETHVEARVRRWAGTKGNGR